MPRLRIQQNVDVDSGALHSKYRHPSGSDYPSWWWQLPERDRREITDLRHRAFHYFIEEAALQNRREKDRPRLIAELRSLGGQLARFRERLGHEDKVRAASSGLRKLRSRAALWRRRSVNWYEAQYAWHRAMVLAYISLRSSEDQPRLRVRDIKTLCKWLSIPEIGVWCTRDTIKAARRRFVWETHSNGRKYRVYAATPRSARSASADARVYEREPEFPETRLQPELESYSENTIRDAEPHYCPICRRPLDGLDHSICGVILQEQFRNGTGLAFKNACDSRR
jgi:hypothetical protein